MNQSKKKKQRLRVAYQYVYDRQNRRSSLERPQMSFRRNRLLVIGILTGILIVLSGLTISMMLKNKESRIQNGSVDLTQWSLEQPINLNGSWAFYWERVLESGEADLAREKPTGFLPVPLNWTKYDNRAFPAIGHAVYELDIELPSSLPSISLNLPRVYSEYKLWANGRLVAQNGLDPEVETVYLTPRLVTIDQLKGNLKLVLQVRNQFHIHAGIVQSPRIGTYDDLFRERTIGLAIDLAIVMVCWFIGLYHLLLIIFRKIKNEFVWFALLCLVVGFRSLMNNQNFLQVLIPNMSFMAGSRIMSLSIPAILLIVLLYLRTVFDLLIPTWLYNLLIGMNITYSAVVLAMPAVDYLKVFNLYLICPVLVSALMVFLSVSTLNRNSTDGLVFATGSLFMVTGGLWDTLFYYQKISTGIGLSLGMAGFAITQALLLAMNHVRSEEDRHSLKQKLAVTDLSYLRAQIKPHFVYNALSTISSAISRDPAEAKSLILDFSDFLRGCFSLEREDGMTTLSSEMATVRAYLSLEKARFRDRLKIIYDLSVEESCLVPMLSIQPIVENAVRHASINPMFEQILDRTSEELGCTTWADMTHPDDLKADYELFKHLKTGEKPDYVLEKRFIRPDQSVVWTRMHVSKLDGLPGGLDINLCLLEDITAHKEAERSKSILLAHLPGFAYKCLYDQDGTMLHISDGCSNLTGYDAEHFILNREQAFNDIITPEHRTFLLEEWARKIPDQLPYQCEYEITTRLGEKKWVLEMGEAIYSESGEVESLEGIILDISARKTAEEQLRYTAEHDPWTGLHNRKHLDQLLRSAASKGAIVPAIVSQKVSSSSLFLYDLRKTQTYTHKN